jgi:hypothetical protein
MNIIVLKTNLSNAEMVGNLKPILNLHSLVHEWTIDLEDVDKVLRIETNGTVEESYFQHLLTDFGFDIQLMCD